MAQQDYRLQDLSILDTDDEALPDEVVSPIWEFPWPEDDSSERPAPWQSVTPGQLGVYSCIWLERELTNGGFAQYFYNPAGHYHADAVDGFKRMRMDNFARITTEAGAILPGEKPSLIRDERIRQLVQLGRSYGISESPDDDEMDTLIETLNDEVFKTLWRKFDQMFKPEHWHIPISRFIRAHPEEFVKD